MAVASLSVSKSRQRRGARPIRPGEARQGAAAGAGEKILPLTLEEVDLVAAECGRFGPLVVFMADCGARPAEVVALEWKHVDLDAGTVELPGAKTDLAWRTVHLTSRGVDALRSVPRSITTRRVFHHKSGKPLSWDYFAQEWWHPALVAGRLALRSVRPTA